MGDGEAYISIDYKIEFSKRRIIRYSEEGNGYLPDIPNDMKINGNIYVTCHNNIYVSKIIDYRFEKVMNKYNILIIKAIGETLVPVKLKPSQLVQSIDGIDIKEFLKNISKRAVYKTHRIDKHYLKLSAEAQDEFLEFVLFFQASPIPLIK